MWSETRTLATMRALTPLHSCFIDSNQKLLSEPAECRSLWEKNKKKKQLENFWVQVSGQSHNLKKKCSSQGADISFRTS